MQEVLTACVCVCTHVYLSMSVSMSVSVPVPVYIRTKIVSPEKIRMAMVGSKELEVKCS